MLLVTGLFLIIVLVYQYVNKCYKYFKNAGIKYSEPTFLFGNVFDFVMQNISLAEFIRSNYEKYKKYRYFGIYQFLRPIVVITDAELLKKITVKDFNAFIDHGIHSSDIDPIWNRTLFAQRGDVWKEARTTLTPAFTGSKMRMMFELMDKCCQTFIKHINAKSTKTVDIEVSEIFKRFSNDCIATCAFGIECNSIDDPKNEFYLKAKMAFDLSGIRSLKPFIYSSYPQLAKLFHIRMITKDVAEFFQKIIDKSLSLRKENKLYRPDIIQLLFEAESALPSVNETDEESFSTAKTFTIEDVTLKKKKFDNVDITAQALLFYLGGMETTSQVITMITYELVANQDIQEKLRKEILEATKGDIDYECIMKLTYLDMVLSETLRKWPVVPLLDRVCTEDYTILAEQENEQTIYIKKNDLVWFPVFGIHRDPNIYSNPDRFDPERFSSKNRHKINPYTYFAFGLGPRNCIGSRVAIMEAKLLMFYILSNYKLVATKKTIIPLELSTKTFNLTPNNGLFIGFEKLKLDE